ICVWFVISAVGLLVARLRFGFELDDAIILSTATLVLAVAGAIYEQLWHRDVLRPLLAHLTQRYRVPVRSIAPSLSLRSKLLLSFGGVVLLACGMALLWGFVQFKNLRTEDAMHQASLRLTSLRSELQTELALLPSEPTEDLVRASLGRIQNSMSAENKNAVVYYIDDRGTMLAVGGGAMGAPKVPWYARGLIENANMQKIDLHGAFLTGTSGRLVIMWQNQRYDLGAIAVFYPSYRGRGESM